MRIEIAGVASQEKRGMTTRVVFQLSAAPDDFWIDAFQFSTGILVTNYPRELFQFEKDTVAFTFFGPRLSEAFETLRLYVADANKKVEEAKARQKPRGEARQREEEKRRQTEMLKRELFGDNEE
jgi:hypothetical protein